MQVTRGPSGILGNAAPGKKGRMPTRKDGEETLGNRVSVSAVRSQSKGVWEHEEEKFSRAPANERPVTLARRSSLRLGTEAKPHSVIKSQLCAAH